MIKCNRCGKMTPAGAFCQSCGTPLAGMVENELSQSSPMMVYQDQPEVPAWLESLRAGERPAAPVNNPVNTNFAPSELIDEASLPSWMSSERDDTRGNTGTNQPIQTYSTSFPGQSGDVERGPSAGFQAQSLIDEKSLPSWMQAANPTPSAPTPSAPVPSAPANSEGLSASSLVQQDNLPEWMKTLQPQPAPKRVNPVQGNQAGRGASSFQLPEQPAPFSSSVTSGFAARDLIDQQSLPSWMKPQNERATDNSGSFSFSQNQNQNQNQPGQGAPTAGQSGFSASSLLEVDALPSWLREGSQNTNQNPRLNTNVHGAMAQPGQNSGQGAWPAVQPSNTAWPGAGAMNSASQAPQPTPGVNPMAPSAGGALSASSFIDSSSLPSWLRPGQQANMTPAQQTTPPGPRPGSYTMPPRVENMRVPSRPRGEVNPTDTSEMAANVFASMLGVASTAPNYPASSQQPDQARQSSVYGQSNQASQNNAYGQPGQGQGNGYAQWGQSATPQSQASMSGLPNPGTMPNTPMGTNMGGGNAFPQNSGMGNSLSGMSGSYGNYPGNAQGQMSSAMGNGMSNSQPLGGGMSPMGNSQPLGGGMSPMGNSQSLNGSSSMNNSSSAYYANSAQSMSNSSAQSPASDGAGELKNKKRGLFESIREWLSR